MSSTDPLQREIEQARAELNATVHDLAEKLDVPKQVRRRVDHTVASVRSHPAVIAAALAGAAAVAFLVVRSRRG